MKWAVLAVASVAIGVIGLRGPGTSAEAESKATPGPAELRLRSAALARARVFRVEPFDPAQVDFVADPNRGLIDPILTTCRFLPTPPTGTTPKFDCELPNGEKVKVKYGWTSEIPAELAATRLLDGLGFGADRMSRVKTVRCYGCAISPFHIRSLMQRLRLDRRFDERIDYARTTDFSDVAVERKLEGESIEAGNQKGWSFHELSQIDSARGGATRAEIDALRLIAMFINHWDNKAANQRLQCYGSDSADCRHPLAMLQDVGSDFGPRKMNLKRWRETPIWSDAESCTLSMADLPYDGATFHDVQISEQGRLLLGGRLKRLSPAQIEGLFTSAGVADVPQWVAAFQSKVRQIADRPACPSNPSS